MLGGVCILRDVVRILCIFFFFSFPSISDILHLVYWSCDRFDIHCTYICCIYYWCIFFHLSLHVLFLFYLYTHVSYIVYAIFYFCFTQKCFDEFYLKCFRNIDCQNLLAINSLLAKFFKSLCYDRFYCIQQVNMS